MAVIFVSSSKVKEGYDLGFLLYYRFCELIFVYKVNKTYTINDWKNDLKKASSFNHHIKNSFLRNSIYLPMEEEKSIL